MSLPIYLDYAATTPVDPAVADKMMQFLTPTGHFGNPASRSHVFGWEAEAAVEDAREQVAKVIGADPREIVWTSGATEANNLAIKGCAHFNQRKGKQSVAFDRWVDVIKKQRLAGDAIGRSLSHNASKIDFIY